MSYGASHHFEIHQVVLIEQGVANTEEADVRQKRPVSSLTRGRPRATCATSSARDSNQVLAVQRETNNYPYQVFQRPRAYQQLCL